MKYGMNAKSFALEVGQILCVKVFLFPIQHELVFIQISTAIPMLFQVDNIFADFC